MTKNKDSLLVLLSIIILTLGQSAVGQAMNLKITEAVVDFVAGTLTITGEDFDFNDISKLEVSLGDSVSGVGPGDITTLCDGVGAFPGDVPPIATTIVCDITGVPLPDGDFLLTVATGNGQSQNDVYD